MSIVLLQSYHRIKLIFSNVYNHHQQQNFYNNNTICSLICLIPFWKTITTTFMSQSCPLEFPSFFFFLLCFRSGSSKHIPEGEKAKQTSFWLSQRKAESFSLRNSCLWTVLLTHSALFHVGKCTLWIAQGTKELFITVLQIIIFVEKCAIQMNRNGEIE